MARGKAKQDTSTSQEVRLCPFTLHWNGHSAWNKAPAPIADIDGLDCCAHLVAALLNNPSPCHQQPVQERLCPLCIEPLDATEQDFYPCPCG